MRISRFTSGLVPSAAVVPQVPTPLLLRPQSGKSWPKPNLDTIRLRRAGQVVFSQRAPYTAPGKRGLPHSTSPHERAVIVEAFHVPFAARPRPGVGATHTKSTLRADCRG